MIKLSFSSAKIIGSCCACNKYIGSHGIIEHRVAEISFQADDSNSSMSVRLCDECLAQLQCVMSENNISAASNLRRALQRL